VQALNAIIFYSEIKKSNTFKRNGESNLSREVKLAQSIKKYLHKHLETLGPRSLLMVGRANAFGNRRRLLLL
jgi:hypothetical protein